MKIHYKKKTFNQILKYQPKADPKPKKISPFFKWLLKVVASFDLKKVKLDSTFEGFEKYDKKQNFFFLMNHASFIDIELGAILFQPRNVNIISSHENFIELGWIMRKIGCVPTRRFTIDLGLVKNILYINRNLNCSVVLYPEAGYTMEGLSNPLPVSLGKMIKLLNMPVAFTKVDGNFHYQPMYNYLNKHKVNVVAHTKVIFSKEDIQKLSVDEINDKLKDLFNIDYWKWQKDSNYKFLEDNYTKGINKILYKCPHCGKELTTVVEDHNIRCTNCNATYRMDDDGSLTNINGETIFNNISDWLKYERGEVKKEIENHTYFASFPVDLFVCLDNHKLFKVKDADAYIEHNLDGISVIDKNNNINFHLNSIELYNIYTEFYWYEIGDMVGLGNAQIYYHCVLKNYDISILKIRYAVEEIYNSIMINKNK